MALAWFYLDKLNVSHEREGTLLASTGNKYELASLMGAALVQVVGKATKQMQ
jgi:hypothetical protein